MAQFDLAQVLRYFRILGLPMSADQDALKQSRRRLLQRYHPDKHPLGWTLDAVPLEVRVQLVQEAYDYLSEHLSAIQETFRYVQEAALTAQMPRALKAHWVYSEIQQYAAA